MDIKTTYYELVNTPFEDLPTRQDIKDMVSKNLFVPIRVSLGWMNVPEKFFIHVDYELGAIHVDTCEYYEFDKNYDVEAFLRSNETSMDVVSFGLRKYPWVIDKTWNTSLRGMFQVLEYCERLRDWKIPIPQTNNRLRNFWTFIVKLYLIYHT